MAANGNLLQISYDRVISTDTVVLTTTNCQEYGYVSTTTIENGVTYTAFYKADDTSREILTYNIEDGVAITEVEIENKQTYTHIAPACSNFKISFADVDKEGSGRNSQTGEMTRERIGYYCKLDLTWDLIPNTDAYNNWYKILTHLPPKFNATLLMPNGNIETKQFYRGDVSTNLYLFISNESEIWKGLSTSFIQWNLDSYNDQTEPTLVQIV